MLMCKWIQLGLCLIFSYIYILFFLLHFCNQKFFAPQSISGNTRLGVFAFADCAPLTACNQITLSIFGWRTFRVFDFDEWIKKLPTKKNINTKFFLHVILLSSLQCVLSAIKKQNVVWLRVVSQIRLHLSTGQTYILWRTLCFFTQVFS